MIYFDSDYMEGAHPEVMQALQETNLEHTVGYGNDPYSEQAREAIREACDAPKALVQFLTLFKDGLYTRICAHAVAQAQRIRKAFCDAGYRVAIDSPTNQQFFVLPNGVIDALRADGVSFEDWGPRGEAETTVRFVTSWATADADIDALTEIIRTI